MTNEVIKITMRDIRAARMCSNGARAFFERHNLDWQKFLKEGLDSDLIEATGDAMALNVVKVAKNGR